MRLVSPLARPWAAAVAALALAALPQPASASELPLRTADASGALGDERLSDEKTITRYTRANLRGTVFSEPDSSSRRITKLHFATEDNYTETYIALESRRIAGVTWIKLRIPMRPNGTTGWVQRSMLRGMTLVRTRLEVNRKTLRATLYRSGKRIWTSRIGVGKAGTPTPAGHFWIRERMRLGSRGGPYGPWAFGTSAYSRLTDWPGGGVIGIHGTNQPGLIPGRPSHGCIRVPNDAVRRLARLMPVGTPVVIT